MGGREGRGGGGGGGVDSGQADDEREKYCKGGAAEVQQRLAAIPLSAFLQNLCWGLEFEVWELKPGSRGGDWDWGLGEEHSQEQTTCRGVNA